MHRRHLAQTTHEGERKRFRVYVRIVDCAAMFRDFMIFEAARADTCIFALCSL
jgi:hypothetical protein